MVGTRGRRGSCTCSQHCGSSSSAVRAGPIAAARPRQAPSTMRRCAPLGRLTRLNSVCASASRAAGPRCSWISATSTGTRSARAQGLPPWIRACPGHRASALEATSCYALGTIPVEGRLNQGLVALSKRAGAFVILLYKLRLSLRYRERGTAPYL